MILCKIPVLLLSKSLDQGGGGRNIYIYICIQMMCSHAQSCPALCDSMGCILPGSSVHTNFQARILAWVAISSSRGSSQPRD